MRNYPVLATRTLPPRGKSGVARTFKVEGGLHYISPNSKPHFTLIYMEHRKGFPNQCQSGGAGHHEILRYYPRFADLAALHLSDIDGEPLHAAANGLYNLAGAIGGAGQQFHVGNSERHMPLPADRMDPAKPWSTTEFRKPTPAECLQIFADYWRIDLTEAHRIANRVRLTAPGWNGVKEIMQEEADKLRPMWKAQAAACISRHGLVVFGDPWPPQAQAA